MLSLRFIVRFKTSDDAVRDLKDITSLYLHPVCSFTPEETSHGAPDNSTGTIWLSLCFPKLQKPTTVLLRKDTINRLLLRLERR